MEEIAHDPRRCPDLELDVITGLVFWLPHLGRGYTCSLGANKYVPRVWVATVMIMAENTRWPHANLISFEIYGGFFCGIMDALFLECVTCA